MMRRAFILSLLVWMGWPAFFLKAANQKPNIVLITLDSTRADRMGFMGSKSGLSANLDELARQGLVFEHAYAQAPLTVVSHATILTGTYPQTHQVSEFGAPLADSVPYLPDLLRASGYRTAAFVGSIRLDPREGLAPGFDRGFETYDAGFHPPQRSESRGQSVQRSGGEVMLRAQSWLAHNSKQPFFLWINLSDPSGPNPTSYERSIRSADAAIGKLLAALKMQKLYDDALIAVVADHAESLGAHGEDTHGIFLYDETIHVPLLLKLPHNEISGKRVPAKVRLVDFAPTVLEAAGLAIPSQMQGQSLLRIARNSPNVDQPVYARSDFPQRAFGWSPMESWRAGKYLYIRAPKPELYDLSADPGATHNLAQSSKGTLDTMAAQLEGFDRHFTQGGKSTTAELSSSEMQKLASLGYVGLQKSASSGAASTGTDPKDVIATANQIQSAMVALDSGQAEKAAAALEPLAARQGNLYLAQYGLGVALVQQQQFAKAIEHLHKAIELQPDSVWAHYEMGMSLLKTGDFKTAAVHLEIASARLPESANIHSLLAQAYEKLGRAEDAKREHAKASGSGSSRRTP